MNVMNEQEKKKNMPFSEALVLSCIFQTGQVFQPQLVSG